MYLNGVTSSVAAMSGRGKTFIARAITRHLEWSGMKVGNFASADCRRRILGDKVPASFFDPTNQEGWMLR